jgi:hypothetical protein
MLGVERVSKGRAHAGSLNPLAGAAGPLHVRSRSGLHSWPSLVVWAMVACNGRGPAAAPAAASATAEPAALTPVAGRLARVVVVPAAKADVPPTVRIEVDEPSFLAGTGPRIGIDQAHHDFHTIDGMFAPFADAARADGFRVAAHTEPFTAASLADLDVLVISNALAERNDPQTGGTWTLPTPSAFTPAEIDALDAWIRDGGRLWLIADHMPFPGAAEALAARLGFRMVNGFAFATDEHGKVDPETIQHTRADGMITPGHPITDGRSPDERVEVVRSFTGQAFEAPDDAVVLLRMPAKAVALLPAEAWKFDEHTPKQDVGGWAVIAAREHDRGRVLVSGEAAMLSARYVRLESGAWEPVGFHVPEARDNLVLVLDALRWLGA